MQGIPGHTDFSENIKKFIMQKRQHYDHNFNKHKLKLTVDKITQFDAERKSRQTKTELDVHLEKCANQHMENLDQGSKSQLSKTQLIKSFEKVHNWKYNRQKSSKKCVVPVEYLNQDLDPLLLLDKERTIVSKPPKEDVNLTGEKFETAFAQSKNTPEEKSDAKERTMTVKEWLAKRQVKLSERDRLRKWIQGYQQDDQQFPIEYIKMWQKKRRDYSVEDWVEIYKMGDSSTMTTNELLKLYRQEVPVKPTREKLDIVSSPKPNPLVASVDTQVSTRILSEEVSEDVSSDQVNGGASPVKVIEKDEDDKTPEIENGSPTSDEAKSEK
eukprot:TRINITY_DN7642_c0_g1_i1.p1 TRINITY_DN7642_c0_g1~~TRINITY_DN7642_c0_g1_i1.p1  ORF type:complete len:327 (-),score=52.94 TRINITY_DN7642_c0_g1_i1:282-1262(-)